MELNSDIVVHIDRSHYKASITNERQTWYADEPLSKGGGDVGPEPYEHLVASLGACTAITLRMYADRKNWPLETADVRLNLERITTGGKDETHITRRITLTGDLTEEQRQRLLDIANHCPVHKLLHSKISVETSLG